MKHASIQSINLMRAILCFFGKEVGKRKAVSSMKPALYHDVVAKIHEFSTSCVVIMWDYVVFVGILTIERGIRVSAVQCFRIEKNLE